ncbi:MAG: hypothetical protein CMN30_12905 [Sandaracinus sp.]|nr:hypothetical protein [Sandaracinus sp.]
MRLAMVFLACSLFACGDDDAALPDAGTDAGGRDAATPDAIVDGPDLGEPDLGVDAGPPDPCADGVGICEDFEGYPELSALADGDRFGPWRAARRGDGIFDLDDTRAVSGSRALHVRIGDGARDGGRLFAGSGASILAEGRTSLHGRLMMYVGDDGHSVHWTWAGVSGPTMDDPVAGLRSTYLFSSLRSDESNRFSSVVYINSDPAQDCWNGSDDPIPAGEWMCLQWSVDSAGRHIEVTRDAAAEPFLVVDETGQGCVGDVANDSPWYGPAIDQLYVGTWSFHPMTRPLEVWIDDVVVDTEPVACP